MPPASDPSPAPLPPDPAVVLDLLEAFRRSKTMFAALELGVFDALADGPATSDALAGRLTLDPAALKRLLDGCVGLQLLERQGDAYANTPAATAYLRSDSPRRLTGYLKYSNAVLWDLWRHLEDAVREGTNRWEQLRGRTGALFSHFFEDEAAKHDFLMGMHGFGQISSPKVVAAFDLGRFRTIVDLGGATGHLTIAACERYPDLRGIVFDLPAAVPLAREIVGASAVADRIEVVAGDFFTDPLPEGDLFALGRILHDWTEPKCRTLLERIHERLPAGGALLIAEAVLDDDHSGPRWPLMQDLNMLVCTEGGERSLPEYAALLTRAGFARVEGRRTGAPGDAVLAYKD